MVNIMPIFYESKQFFSLSLSSLNRSNSRPPFEVSRDNISCVENEMAKYMKPIKRFEN